MGFRGGPAPASARDTKKAKEITTATYQILPSDHGKTLLLNRAAGIVVTLPADSLFFGFTVELLVRETFTGTFQVAPAADGDLMYGGITAIALAASKSSFFMPAHFGPLDHDNYVADADTKGRHVGTNLKFTLMGTNEWMVSGIIHTVGTPANPFSNG